MVNRMRHSITRFALVAIAIVVMLGGLAPSVQAEVKLASIFADNLVLQRDTDVPVWGTATPSETVTVLFAGQETSGKAGDDGRWMVKLAPMPANAEPAELTAREGSGSSSVTLKNLLVGEVWLCGGQSNMALQLRDAFNAKEESAAANYPAIRFVTVPAAAHGRPTDQPARAKWHVCTPESAADFAAVAYFFGRSVHREVGVPVGLIETAIGSTGIEGWAPLEGYKIATEPALQATYREVASWDPASELGKQAHAEAFAKIHAWLPQAKAALAEGKPVPPQPLLPAPPKYRNGPTTIYNGTIRPLVPYAIRGAIWYQGEANPGEGESYELNMKALVTGWRAVWGRDDFPFYYVQLANEGKAVERPDEEQNFRYVPVREAQRRSLKLPNSGMAVAIDLGEDANGHPRNKKDVGERLALWALAKTYGKDVPYSGPLYRSVQIDGDRAIISFDHVGKGLMIGDKDGLEPVREIKGGELKHFSIRGEDGSWRWAEAKIVGDTVVVRSERVTRPVAVRYADSMNPKGNKLYNREGLPASPFRTDGW
jgi:sialate O-acetylesterase